MRRVVLAVFLLSPIAFAANWSAESNEPMIGHMVYFQLNDPTPENIKRVVAGCDKHLSDHQGVVHYSAGTMAKEFNRPINDRDWDVALHMIFKTKADHDRYQDHERHKKLIEEHKTHWKKVRVFDSHIHKRN